MEPSIDPLVSTRTTPEFQRAADAAGNETAAPTLSSPRLRIAHEEPSSPHDSYSELAPESALGNSHVDPAEWGVAIKPQNIYKLKTKEDPFSIHKILGILCLLHYIYRFGMLALTGSMGFEANSRPQLLALIALHAALSWSSFIFHLPPRRNKWKPMIWPELRAHNVVFATRSLLDMLVHVCGLGSVDVLRVGLAYLAMVVADKVTEHYKRLALLNPGDSTMRGMPWPKDVKANTVWWTNQYYALSQLGATAGVINISRLWRFDVEAAFLTLFAIQISALLLTLVRKSIVPSFAFHFWYGLALGLSWVHLWVGGCAFTPVHMFAVKFFAFAALAVFLRFKLGISKYIFWALFSVCDVFAFRKAYLTQPFEAIW